MTTLAPALAERHFPKLDARLRDGLLVLSGALLVAALAQVRIPLPFTPVPVTGQTLGVLLVGALLGSRRGAASLGVYLLAGVAGLPFFAGGASGAGVLFGATGGYLFGFVLAAWLVGRLSERGLERKTRSAWLAFLVGEIAIYALGVPWLALFVGGLEKALLLGFVPFVAGDLLKAGLAGLLLPAGWRLLGE
jgi:biotin transport system substrate-specific component